ncbi:MAG: TrkH family potassium uptake protein [Firmicutes bacterium]|nr:TrkH family potassium uptake protein [Bacillota bacterium]
MIIHLRSIAKTLGHLLTFTGAALIVPLLYAAYTNQTDATLAFLVPAAFALAIGASLSLTYKDACSWITLKDSLLLTSLSWICVSIIGALPYLIAGLLHSPFSAFFESVSAFTTTGATVFLKIGDLPRAFLLWRSFAQWIGGIGILVLMQTLLPVTFENQGSLIKSESTGVNTDNIFFNRKNTSRAIYAIYIGMTLLQALLLKLGGLSTFDSILFSFGTSASGGMNHRTEGLLHMATPFTEAVMAVFMLISCVSFAVYFAVIKKDKDSIRRNTELKAYLGIAAGAILLISADLYFTRTFATVGDSLRHGGFQAISFLTTTGYASADFNTWPAFSKMMLTVLGFFGGCSSSTGGALKVIRIVILSKMIWRSFTTRIHPNAVVTIKTNQKPLPSSIANGVVSYTLTFFLLFLAGAFVLTFDTNDFQTAFTASAAMLCNTGAGCGQMGMLGQYYMFHPLTHLFLSFLMLAGRLEIYAVILPLSRNFWREKI